MGVTRKSSTLIRFSIINHPCWGTSIYGDPHMFRSAESSVFLIAIFFIKNKWEADVRCVALSTVKSDQFEVARSVCQYAIYCNSFVCTTMCPMILGQWFSVGNFCQRPKVGNLVSQRWFLWAMECQTPPKRFIAGRDWKALNALVPHSNFLFRIATWANFSLLVWFRWSASASFRILHSQWCFQIFSFYVFSSHDVADQMCQEPIALVPWVVVWPSSNPICYVRELSFEFEDVWSAAFFKCSWNRGEKRLSLAKNSQLTGEDIYWHFCMSADVFRMSLMYTYLYILITYYLLYCAQVCFLVLKLNSLNDVAKWKMKKQFSFEGSWRFVHALFLSQSFRFFLNFKQPFWLPFLMAFFKSE